MKTIITNAPAALAYNAYLAAVQTPTSSPAAIEASRSRLRAVVEEQAATGQPGTGVEVQSTNRDGTPAFSRSGQPVTRSGMAPGTPFAVISRLDTSSRRRRYEMCKVWPCGTLDSSGPSCFAI
jgi:hypothetical protein